MPQLRVVLALLLLPLLVTSGCDAHFSLNECDAAPPLGGNDDYMDLEVGRSVIDGPDGRLHLAAHVDALQESGNRYIALGESVGEVPRMTLSSNAIDLLSLSEGEERSVGAFYHVDGAGEGGPGLLRVTHKTSTETSGVFSGCVHAENRAIPLSGPTRIVQGGFTVSQE